MDVKFYEGFFPKPKKEEILITHSIKPKDIEFLINKKYGNKIYSNDKGNKNYKDVEEKIDELYNHLNIKRTDHFTSLVIRTTFSSGLTNNPYGNITLVLKKDKIEKDTVIFNGDVQDLALDSQKYKTIQTYSLNEKKLLNKLEVLNGNQHHPKLRGPYFEARLFRELRLDDIKEIIVKKEDSEACIMAKKLANYIDYKLFEKNIESSREKQSELKREMVSHFRNFFSNLKFDIISNNRHLDGDMSLFSIKRHPDIDKLIYGTGFYIIFTDCKFNDNSCMLVIDDKFKAVYRGHGTRLKKRIESHLFNNKYNESRDQTNYEVCMKIEEGVSGINIDEDNYKIYNWYVLQWKMKNSSKIEREQAERAFDEVFGKPLACRERE